MIKTRIIQILFTIALIPIWGLGLLNNQNSSKFLVLCTFLFTLLLINIIPQIDKKDLKSRLIVFLGPTFYVIASLGFTKSNSNIFLFPIFWIYILFFTAYIFRKRMSVILILIIFSTGYSLLLYPKILLKQTFTNRDIKVEPTKKNISKYEFLNYEFDTINLENSDKSVLFETWNQSCRPCLTSIKDLEEEVSKITSLNHFYIYQFNQNEEKNISQILNSTIIKNKEKILFDINDYISDSLEINSFPYFLFFNKSGELKKYIRGYSRDYKDSIYQEIYTNSLELDENI